MSLIKYPTHPKELPQNYDYKVTVTQGDETIELPVYNSSRQSSSFSNIKNADAYRRFCEFSFTGEVTVTVTSRLPMESYSILPTSKKIPSTTFGNKIIFTIQQPVDLCLRLNDDKNTILAIFAEAPEENIPDENDPDVIYFKAGLNNSPFYNVDTRGVMLIPENKTVYLEAGALVQARLECFSNNVKFCGRGAFIDPRFDRNADFTYMFYGSGKKDAPLTGLRFEELRFLDAHCFNLCFSYIDGMVVDKVKLLSNQISTDGMSFWASPCSNITMQNMFMHITDNAFVCSVGENMVAKNCTIGTDYGIFYPQGNIESINFENIDLFRCGDFFRATVWGGERKWKNITVNNVRAADSLKIGNFVNLRTQGVGEKNVYIKNVSLPKSELVFSCGGNTEGAVVHFENVFNGDKVLDSADGISKIYDPNNANKMVFNGFDGTYAPQIYRDFPATYEGDTRIYIGDYLVPNLKNPVVKKDGEWLIPADILPHLGLEKVDEEYLPLSYFEGTRAEDNKIFLTYPLKDNNLISDPSFETAYCEALPEPENGVRTLYSQRWSTFDFGRLFCVKDKANAYSGERFLRVAKDACVRQCGVTHELFQEVQKFGAGTYHLSAMARLGYIDNPPDDAVYMGIVQGNWRVFNDDDKENEVLVGINDIKEFKLTTQWQKISYDVKITAPSVDGYDRCFFFVGPKTRVVENPADPKNRYEFLMDFFLDDVEVTFTKD